MKFIHAADIHLDSPLRGLDRYEGAPVDEIRTASRRALENLVRLAIDEQVDFVLIAGDLYDGDWKDHNTGLFFVKQITQLRDAGIPLYAISGNHDAENKMTRSLRLPTNPDGSAIMLPSGHADTVLLEEIGVAVHGRGFTSAKVTDNVAVDYPARHRGMFNIGMLHTSLDGEGGSDHARYAPCKLSDLIAKQYDYWALGHVHTRQLRGDEAVVAFPGNLQGRHIREAGAKGCLLVSVDERGEPRVEFKPLDVFRWITCEVAADACQQPEDVLDEFSSQLEQQISQHTGMPLGVRVAIQGACSAHRQLSANPGAWANELRNVALQVSSGGVWVEKVKLSTKMPVEESEEETTDGPVGELLDLLGQLRKDASLLDADAAWRRELDNKLPAEVTAGVADEQSDVEMIDEIEGLLLGRLAEARSNG